MLNAQIEPYLSKIFYLQLSARAKINLWGIQQLRGQEEGEGGVPLMSTWTKIWKKSSYFRKYFIPLHTDTWVYKTSKHEFCVLASKHASLCKNRSSLNKNCHWWWKSTQIELFWDLFNTSVYGDFTIENQVFQCTY